MTCEIYNSYDLPSSVYNYKGWKYVVQSTESIRRRSFDFILSGTLCACFVQTSVIYTSFTSMHITFHYIKMPTYWTPIHDMEHKVKQRRIFLITVSKIWVKLSTHYVCSLLFCCFLRRNSDDYDHLWQIYDSANEILSNAFISHLKSNYVLSINIIKSRGNSKTIMVAMILIIILPLFIYLYSLWCI